MTSAAWQSVERLPRSQVMSREGRIACRVYRDLQARLMTDPSSLRSLLDGTMMEVGWVAWWVAWTMLEGRHDRLSMAQTVAEWWCTGASVLSGVNNSHPADGEN